MKKTNLLTILVLSGSIIFSGCASMSNTGKGAAIGAGGGAALGAGIGALVGKGKGAAIGAAVGGAVGAGTGALIGRKMVNRKRVRSLKGLVETVTDANDLQAIKVTFDNGILFATNSSQLSSSSRDALTKFATSLKNSPETDITIYGHTDNTGTRAVNERISKERAEAVANFLVGNGIARNRITTEGLAFDQPVADNSTAEGRAKNRRVEVYITASANMIKQAEEGTLK